MSSLLIPGLLNPKTDSWKLRHNRAVTTARLNGPDHASTIVRALYAWHDYATAHKTRFESSIGEDYILGPGWSEWGLGIRVLLNGETGALDCGTCDAFILDTLNENGIDTSKL